MGFRDDWYPKTIAGLIQLRGEAKADTRGNRLPATSPLDTIGILGMLSSFLIDSIAAFSSHQGMGGKIPRASDVNIADGSIRGSVISVLSNSISSTRYVAGYGDSLRPWLRSVDSDLESTLYTLGTNVALGAGESAHVAGYREAMHDWQRAIDASAGAIGAQAFDLAAPMHPESNAAFWDGVRRLCTSLDGIGAVPPQGLTLDRAKAAASHALDKSAEFAGEAAAKLSEKTGEIIGHFGKGFFEAAGVTSLLVAGIAVYLFIR